MRAGQLLDCEKIANEFTFDLGFHLPSFSYRQEQSYHCIQKKLDPHKPSDENAEIPYYTHQVHLGLYLISSDTKAKTLEKIWKLLLKIFKDECIYEVRLVDPTIVLEEGTVNARLKPCGREAVIYFLDKKYFPDLSNDEFLLKHIRVMRKLDKQIKKLALPLSRQYPKDHSTENLGCTSNAIYISPPKRNANDQHRRRAGTRGEFVNPYLAVEENMRKNEPIPTRNRILAGLSSVSALLGATGGAAVGALIGAPFFGIGAVIGGVIGGAIGFVGGAVAGAIGGIAGIELAEAVDACLPTCCPGSTTRDLYERDPNLLGSKKTNSVTQRRDTQPLLGSSTKQKTHATSMPTSTPDVDDTETSRIGLGKGKLG